MPKFLHRSKALLRAAPSRRAAVGAAALVACLVAAATFATGLPPFVRDDSATVPHGGRVSILDNGQASVLANDFDFERDPMTAHLTSAPRRGTVVLNPDGTFEYVHDGSSSNSDEFRYRAFDGTSFSREAAVRIAVTAAAVAPRITGQRALAVPEDGALEIRLLDLVVEDPDSQFPQDFTLHVGDGENYTRTGATVMPDADFNGTLTVPTRVNDGQADSNEFPLQVSVSAVNDAPVVLQTVGTQEATEGEPFELDFAPHFADVDGDTLTFTASGLPPSGSLSMSPAGLLAGTPVDVDTLALEYQVAVTVRDPSAAQATMQFVLRILPRRVDLALAIAAQPEPATIGAAPQWSLEVSNISTNSSEPATLTAQWHSTGAPVTLTPPSECLIINEIDYSSTIECEVPALPAGGRAIVRVQSAQTAPGDEAVHASLDADDAAAANNFAFKSLSLAGSFNEPAAQRLAGAAADVAAGDLDGDGHLDVVAAGERVRIYFNTGAKAFEAAPVIPGGESAGETVALIDWNRDGRLDVAILRSAGAAGRTFSNDGARGFAAGPRLPAVSARAAVPIDADGDGFFELAVVGAQGTALLAPGAAMRLLDGRAGVDIAAADLDGDGREDLAVALGGGAVAVLRATGAGAFASTTLSGFASIAGISAADVTGDGVPDLLLAVDAADSGVPANVLLRNEGGATFTTLASLGATETKKLLAADVDGDASVDVVAINASGVHQVYLGPAALELALAPEFVLSPGTATAALDDFDGDGVPDLVLAGANAPSIEMLRNNGIGRFGPGDVTPPVIALVGQASVTIEAASAYVDPGATASDDVAGDLTAAIVVTNPVDAAVVGTYRVSYDVTDRAGNAADTAVRTVEVVAATGGGGGGGSIGAEWLLTLVLAAWSAAAAARGAGRVLTTTSPPKWPAAAASRTARTSRAPD